MIQPTKIEITEDMIKHGAAVHEVFTTTCQLQNLVKSDFVFDMEKVGEAALRTLRRVYFYSQYHKSDMSEVKEAAVLAFWILKYKPISPKTIRNGYSSEHINEYVAINIILHSIERTRLVNNIAKPVKITILGYKQIIYRLKNWDLSKESLMTLADILYYYEGSIIDNLDTEESKFGRIL